MDAAIFPSILSLAQLPVSPPPDHNLFFHNSSSNNHNNHNIGHCPTTQAPPAAVLANPLLLKSFAREMEGPTVKKAPSLLEKHYSAKRTASEAQLQQQQQQQQPFTGQKQPDTPTSLTPSTGSASSSVDTKVQSPPAHEHNHKSHQQPQSPSSPPPPKKQKLEQPLPQPQQQQQHPSSSPPLNNPFLHLAADPTATATTTTTGGLAPNDPKYIQMVSRMAAYYQQRCQAILNFQQQRCQTWATSHRQKCQEMMQAAMLVVAWYIRDRIGRRRRRTKRAFRRGLREKNTAAVLRRVPKGETVRKWVLGIPETNAATAAGAGAGAGGAEAPITSAAELEALMMSPSLSSPLGNGNKHQAEGPVLDAEERAFDVDKEVTPDKDSQLFAVADQMIKSQLAKIDVPLLGALNLDDSESETDDDDAEEGLDKYYARHYGGGGGADDYENEYEDEEEGEEEEEEEEEDDGLLDYDDEDEEEDSYVEDVASKEAMHGTGKGSLKRKRSESTSGVEL